MAVLDTAILPQAADSRVKPANDALFAQDERLAMTDPVPLLQALIRCPSVTPKEGGALALAGGMLGRVGFKSEHLRFSAPDTPEVENLFARFGSEGKHFCFAGHTDVVPAGDEASWTHGPFDGAIAQGFVYGRGASDMKGSVAAFMAAAMDFLAEQGPRFAGSISLLLTGDEEGPAINGTRKVLAWLAQQSMVPDHCLVGEPTCLAQLGDSMKIGRRGSLNAAITVIGRQGHSAYPQHADNPIPKLVRLLDRLGTHVLDRGMEPFEPSHLAITSVDVGNKATNVTPERASARLNIRFNPLHKPQDLQRWIEAETEKVRAELGGRFEISFEEPSEAFLSEPGAFVDLVRGAVEDVTGLRPKPSVSGGTSDARFIAAYCPVVEFGPTNATIHQVDERMSIDELMQLKAVYQAVLLRYFGA
jgi:succinyl-diaminopimelate desuccinylase